MWWGLTRLISTLARLCGASWRGKPNLGEARASMCWCLRPLQTLRMASLATARAPQASVMPASQPASQPPWWAGGARRVALWASGAESLAPAMQMPRSFALLLPAPAASCPPTIPRTATASTPAAATPPAARPLPALPAPTQAAAAMGARRAARVAPRPRWWRPPAALSAAWTPRRRICSSCSWP